MNGYLTEAGAFLISIIFGFIILMVMLRFILQWARADFYNPISQFIVKITDPMLKPFRRIIPGFGGLDIAAIVLMLILKFVEILLIVAIGGQSLNLLVILIISATGLLSLFLYVFIFAIIIMAIASWIAPGNYNPVLNLIQQLIAPIMRPIQKRLKPVSGMDLSPLAALLILNLVVMAIPHLQKTLLQLVL
ncbi:MAG: YggT family protein [Gammaproteobacteria bacterium]|nr:YggT family protein [Gammaproteobacteria bacterium]